MRKSYTFLLVSLCLFLTTHAQNSSLNLTGSNFVTAGQDVVNPNGDFSIEFWAFVPTKAADGVTPINQNGGTLVSEGSSGSSFYVAYEPDGTIQVGDFWTGTGVPMVFDKWTHIAVTFQSVGNLTSLFVDGKLKATTTDFFFTDDQSFRIGVQVDLTLPMIGAIDEVKAWNVARTAPQVRTDMLGAPNASDNTLIAWYEMDDGSGITVSNSATNTGTSQKGTISGDPAVNPNPAGFNSWASSPVQFGNNALTFDGVDDHVTIPALADNSYDLSSTNGGTVELWVNPLSLGTNWSTILGNRGSGGVRYSFHLSATQIGVDNGTNINTLNYAVQTGANKWTHLAFVIDGTNPISVYVNGALQGTITDIMAGSPVGTGIGQNITLGTADNPSNGTETPFNGGIDEVRIWNYKRSQTLIAANKDFTLTGNESGLIGQFSFDMGPAGGDNADLLTAFDNSPNFNNGTLANFALSGTTSNFAQHVLAAVPLPITLTAFSANRTGDEVTLTWQTAMEENTRNFIIERSTDGKTYTAIGDVTAAGNSTKTLNYLFVDPQPGQNSNFYRLKQVDLDGNYAYSPVRVVNMPTTTKLIWHPTGRNSAEILLQQGNNEPYFVFDAAGRVLRSGRLSNGRTNISQLPPGIYFVRAGSQNTTILLQ